MPDGVIKINPAVFRDGRDALAVAWNEGLRLWMEDHGYQPVSEPTDEQRERLSSTAYADDEEALRKTILARIATRDTSAPNPTPEQAQEVMDLLRAVADSLDPGDPDIDNVAMLMEDLGTGFNLPYDEMPAGEIPEDMLPAEGGVPQEMPVEGEVPVEGEMPPELPAEEGVPQEMPTEMPTEMAQEAPVAEGGAS